WITRTIFAVRQRMAGSLRLEDGEPAWRRFLDRFPSIAEQFEGAAPTLPFVYAPRLTYRCSMAAGAGWLMLPSAAAFIDPLFSTGFPLSLLGIQRIGQILEDAQSVRNPSIRTPVLAQLVHTDA